ncbi:unnamed protein product, partial [Larinioides sclopetarius]
RILGFLQLLQQMQKTIPFYAVVTTQDKLEQLGVPFWLTGRKRNKKCYPENRFPRLLTK